MKIRYLYLFIFISTLFLKAGFAVASENFPEFSTNQELSSAGKIRLIGLNQRKHFGLPAKRFYLPETDYSEDLVFDAKLESIQPDSLPKISILPLDQSGRTELIVSSVGLTLLYYGWAIPTALNAENGRAYVASYMLLGGASFFVPFLATRSNQISGGMARGFTTGGLLGIPHGWGFALAAQGNDMEWRLGLGTSVVTSLLEAKLLMQYARVHNLSLGHMSLMGNLGFWGGALAAPLPVFFDSENSRVYAGSFLAGSGLGLWAGDQLARKISVKGGDAQVMSTTGALGGLVAIAVLNSVSDDFTKASLATLLTATAGGLGYGYYKIKQSDYSQTDAQLIGLGTLAGGLIGIGTVYVASNDPSGEAYLWGTAAGAVGGFFLTEYLVNEKDLPKLGTLRFQLNPLAFRQFFKSGAPIHNNQSQLGQQYMVNASLQF